MLLQANKKHVLEDSNKNTRYVFAIYVGAITYIWKDNRDKTV